MNLYLIGYRGSGKTTVGPLLAQRLGWTWCDADPLIEERTGSTIRRIFEEEGEEGFRRREADLLAELVKQEKMVISTGGGIVLRDENRAILKQGRVVWLTAPVDVLWRRMQADATTRERRPDLAQGGIGEIEAILKARTPLYEACADLTVDAATHTPEQIADLVVPWFRDTTK